MQFMGGLSYPLYLNHYAFGLVVVGLWSTKVAVGAAFVLSLMMILAVSYLVFFMERVVQRRVKSYLAI